MNQKKFPVTSGSIFYPISMFLKKNSFLERYDNEAPQNAKKEEDRLLFESTIKNKANVDKTCILKSVPPKVAGLKIFMKLLLYVL
jgi:hypothetical protein